MAGDREGRRLDELEFRVWRTFLYAYAEVVPVLDAELTQAVEIGLNQFEVLTWLRRAGRDGLRMSELASRVVMSPSGVTRAVDQLERKGLVERCVFEGDKRGQLAKLTPEGRAVLGKATAAVAHGARAHFLGHMSRTQLEHLADALHAVLAGEGSPLPRLSAS